MKINKRQLHDIFRRSLTSFLRGFRHVLGLVLTEFEQLEEKLELVAKPTVPHLTNKVVMITGASEYIGIEIGRQVARFHPSCVLLLGNELESLARVENELSKQIGKHTKVVSFISNIQDKKRLFELMGRYKPSVIFHAVGDQQVDFTQQEVAEIVYAQAQSTRNMAEAANRFHVDIFVLISSEKAAKPVNLNEASKKLAEIIVESVSATSSTQYKIIRLSENFFRNGLSVKTALRDEKNPTHTHIIQQILHISGKEALFSKGDLSQFKKRVVYTELPKQKRLSQIELARLLKQLKKASEEQVRELVISIMKQ